jgi:putative CocE/NonD family hydrolase
VQALSGPQDQAAMELGNNLLVYVTKPHTERMHIFGRPRVVLYAATSAAHADMVAKLVRVMLDGRVEFVCVGIARSSWMFGEAGYEADCVKRWEFALEPTSVVLQAGERLGLEIASSSFPLYDRNPSTAVSPEQADNWSWARSTQQIVHTAECASALHLPLIGGGGWPS